MPTIQPDAERVTYKFKGHEIKVPVIAKAGDTLTENLARFVNRQGASVTGNVLGTAINRKLAELQEANDKLPDGDANKRAKDKPFTPEDLSNADVQTMFDTIFTNYEFGAVNTREGVAHDPVQAIANNIAWEKLKLLMKKRNIKVNTVKPEKKAALIKDLLARDPSIMESAKSQVGGEKPTDGMDDLLAGLGGEAETGGDTNSGSDTGTGGEGASAPATNGQDEPTATPETPPPTPAETAGQARKGGTKAAQGGAFS